MSQILNPGNNATGGTTGNSSPATFTKERVNELMQKRIERSHQAFFKRYGVSNLEELDALFGKSKIVDELKQQLEESSKSKEELQTKFDELTNQNKDLTKKYAFTSRNIRPEKYSDIETYFKGKGLDINETTLNEELKTHEDWCNKVGNVVPLGNENPGQTSELSERERASALLGVQL
jgi:membrane-associated HD superfamily phosphohydrolase